MKRLILITEDPIDPGEFFQEPGRRSSGAAVTFVGLVREEEGEKKIEGINYEVYEEMAKLELEKLLDEAQGKWSLQKIIVLHRSGFVRAGEAAILVQVFSQHRGEAFEAVRYIIDRLKQIVPIWKNPIFNRTLRGLESEK